MALHGYTPAGKGRGVLFLGNVFLYVLVTAPILSLCLMGEKWWHIFFAMTALALPCVLLVGLLVALFDEFSFDDARQQIVRPLRRAIPYSRVLHIDMNATGRLIQVSIREGVLSRSSLVHALDIKDKARLTAELLRRFPRAVIQERTYGDWRSLLMVMAVVVVLTTGFHLVIYRGSFSNVRVPQKVVWAAMERPAKDQQQYTVGRFQIAMPRSFHRIAKGLNALLFEDEALKTDIQFVAAPQREGLSSRYDLIRQVTGIGDYFDVLDTAYSARIGVIPLALKEVALTGLADINLLAIERTSREGSSGTAREAGRTVTPILQSELKGFAVQGKKKGKEITTLLLRDTAKKAEMHIFISGPVRVDEKALQSIVAGVSLIPD